MAVYTHVQDECATERLRWKTARSPQKVSKTLEFTCLLSFSFTWPQFITGMMQAYRLLIERFLKRRLTLELFRMLDKNFFKREKKSVEVPRKKQVDWLVLNDIFRKDRVRIQSTNTNDE